MPKPYTEMNKHEKHSYLVDKVRREYQVENNHSRLFKNTSGMAWQGHVSNFAGKVELLYPRPIRFGIPEPKPNEEDGSGGADLLGQTAYCELRDHNCINCQKLPCGHMVPIITGIEVKTGKSRLKKNQKIFKEWVLRINGIYFLARECPACKGAGYLIKIAKTVAIPSTVHISNHLEYEGKEECVTCDGNQYVLEEG